MFSKKIWKHGHFQKLCKLFGFLKTIWEGGFLKIFFRALGTAIAVPNARYILIVMTYSDNQLNIVCN